MAEHNDGNRGGNDRGNFGGGRNSGGGGFRGTNNSGGDPRGYRARDDRGPEGARPSSSDRDRKPLVTGRHVKVTASRTAVAGTVSRMVTVLRVKVAESVAALGRWRRS